MPGRRDTAVGLAVVALIVAGSLVARGRQVPRATTPPAPVPAGAVATPSSPPDVTAADATVDLGEIRVLVSAGPRPLRPFARNRYRFRAEVGGQPVRLEEASISFTMSMPMGDHRYSLLPAAEGWQEAEAVLPLCPSGKRRWFGDLAFRLAGKARSARFQFDLKPEPQAAASP